MMGKKHKTNKPLDVFESEKAQAQLLIDEAVGNTLSVINQHRSENGLELVSIRPEVNEKKRKVTSLYRLSLGNNSQYCGNFQQVINILHDAQQSIARAKVDKEMQEQKQKAEQVAEMEKALEQEREQHE